MFRINVPYSEKDKASKLGAKWIGEKSSWFVPDDVDLEFFLRWIDKKDLEIAHKIISQQQPEKGIKLSNLLTKVKLSIEEELKGFYWLNAEIANIQKKGETLYLQLTENDSKGNQICNNRAVIWPNNLNWIEEKFNLETGQNLQKGINVLLKVKLTYDIKYQLSIVVLDIDPKFTLGGIESKIKSIRDKITALNLYDKNKKFNDPEFYKKIAVISPEDAAGLGDFRSDADKLEKFNICSFKYYTATFQGSNANKSISTAIKKASFDNLKENFDIVVIIRGGGAKTDLHFLNEFDIAKSLCDCPIPVFTGIGHERDSVFLDEISFLSFDTPSKVINYVANKNINFANKIKDDLLQIKILKENSVTNFRNKLDSNYDQIKSTSLNVVLKNKENINNNLNKVNEMILIKKSNFKMKIEELYSNFKTKSSNCIKKYDSDLNLMDNNFKNNRNVSISNYNSSLSILVANISMLSPLNSLKNGFAIIKNKNGEIITSIEKINKEEKIIIMMNDGEKEIKIGESNGV